MSERALTTLERDLVLAEAPERDRALLDFCRRLAQSNPRPEKPAYDALRAVGMSDGAIREAAFLVAMTCAANRTGTMLAIPPDVDVERMPDRLLVRAFRPVVGWLARRSGKPAQRSADAPAYTGPYARVLTLLGDSQSALHFGDVLGAMFASSALGRRAILLIFAVVSRALACDHCEGEACANLAADGLAEPEVLRIVTLLDSPALTPTERAVVELARNSVRYHTPAIQEHARKLAATIGRDLTIEAVGVCGIANAVVRLAMLHECA
jgi:alkylhydroperoxidase family enzyme